jgi:hypothetical protein
MNRESKGQPNSTRGTNYMGTGGDAIDMYPDFE